MFREKRPHYQDHDGRTFSYMVEYPNGYPHNASFQIDITLGPEPNEIPDDVQVWICSEDGSRLHLPNADRCSLRDAPTIWRAISACESEAEEDAERVGLWKTMAQQALEDQAELLAT